VHDQGRAVRFYTEKVGLKVVQDAPYEDGWRWIELEIPGAQTRLTFTKRKDGDLKDDPRLVLITDDVKKAHQDLAGKGVVFTKEPADSPWAPGQVFAQFRDSEGNGVLISTS